MMVVTHAPGFPSKILLNVDGSVILSEQLAHLGVRETAETAVKFVRKSAEYPEPTIQVVGNETLYKILTQRWVLAKWTERYEQLEEASLERCIRSEFIAAEMRNRK